jgi:hypothetical protein
MRKQMHEQFSGFRSQGELGVMVFDPLHQEVEMDFGLGFGGGADENDDRVEDSVAEAVVLELCAEEVGFYEEGEAGLGFCWG